MKPYYSSLDTFYTSSGSFLRKSLLVIVYLCGMIL